MNIVLLTHPNFFRSQSMPRFAQMIERAFLAKGHSVVTWTAPSVFSRLGFLSSTFQKWLGYIDSYIIFPFIFYIKIRFASQKTIYVFADQALGPWVPLVANKPHIIHVHDFMALRSALGDYPENPTSISGKIYQRFIRWGFSKGYFFAPVSQASKHDLLRLLNHNPQVCEVIYNGLNFDFHPLGEDEFVQTLEGKLPDVAYRQYLLHVGGNQWYKNRPGVLSLYREYSSQATSPLPLVMIGPFPTDDLLSLAREAEAQGGRIYFQSGLTGAELRAAYSGAALLLFPSLCEGFGWPIAEAMASDCLVVTTDEAPMTEVGGDAAFYLPRRPYRDDGSWSVAGAAKLHQILALSEPSKAQRRTQGRIQAASFKADKAIDAYEVLYQKVLEAYS